MDRNTKHLVQDLVFIILSVCLAVYIGKSGLVEKCMDTFYGLKYTGIFLSGMFFTSVFSTAPAIVLLGEFSKMNNILVVAVLGALGAVVGDYIIFRFVRDRISEDIGFLLEVSKIDRFPNIFKTKIFHYFIPFMGALIIASPFPDEMGIALLGISKVNGKIFFLISFVFNMIGIIAIAFIARSAF